jgi:hypothetical protein
MRDFSVSLVIDQLPLSDENLDRFFGVEDLSDAIPSSIDGIVTVTSPVRAMDAEAAIASLAAIITETFPNAIVVRVEEVYKVVSADVWYPQAVNGGSA